MHDAIYVVLLSLLVCLWFGLHTSGIVKQGFMSYNLIGPLTRLFDLGLGVGTCFVPDHPLSLSPGVLDPPFTQHIVAGSTSCQKISIVIVSHSHDLTPVPIVNTEKRFLKEMEQSLLLMTLIHHFMTQAFRTFY